MIKAAAPIAFDHTGYKATSCNWPSELWIPLSASGRQRLALMVSPSCAADALAQ